MPNATTPAQYVLILIDLAEQSGCARDRLLAGTSLTETGIDRIGARVEDRDFTHLANNAMALTGRPDLGLELGMRLNLGAHAILGQAFMTCHNLGEAIELFIKYHHLLSSSLEVSITREGDHCCFASVETPYDLPPHFAHELLYSAFLNTLRGLLNMPDLQMRVDLPYPPPDHAHRYRQVFGENVYFDRAEAGVRFDTGLMQAPLPSSNPALRKLYEQECARLLADLEEGSSIGQQTLRLLRKLEGQYPQMPQIAQMLNLSPRTYRRRLEREDESFQRLLDKVRAEHATHYLRNTRLPLATIAYRVGLNDTSNFRRAYQKWTGRTPSEVRHGD
jgi:AraC-like DNA-binding protein